MIDSWCNYISYTVMYIVQPFVMRHLTDDSTCNTEHSHVYVYNLIILYILSCSVVVSLSNALSKFKIFA